MRFKSKSTDLMPAYQCVYHNLHYTVGSTYIRPVLAGPFQYQSFGGTGATERPQE